MQQGPLFSGSIILRAVVLLSVHHFGASLSFVEYFFLLFSMQQELICLPGFVFSCFFQVPSEGMLSAFHCPSTQNFLDFTCGNSKKAAHHIYLSIIN